MSQLNKDYNKNLPEYVYFDINVANKRQTTQQSEPFSYNEIRSSPFLDGPSGSYKMSIIRFSVNTDSPVFIPQIQSNQTGINLKEYTITMTGPNAVASVNVHGYINFQKRHVRLLQVALPLENLYIPLDTTIASRIIGLCYF